MQAAAAKRYSRFIRQIPLTGQIRDEVKIIRLRGRDPEFILMQFSVIDTPWVPAVIDADAHIVVVKEQKEWAEVDEDFPRTFEPLWNEAAPGRIDIGDNNIVLARNNDIDTGALNGVPGCII